LLLQKLAGHRAEKKRSIRKIPSGKIRDPFAGLEHDKNPMNQDHAKQFELAFRPFSWDCNFSYRSNLFHPVFRDVSLNNILCEAFIGMSYTFSQGIREKMKITAF
jgi:hypothetical protein